MKGFGGLGFTICCLIASTVYAGIPSWIIDLPFVSEVDVPIGGTAQVTFPVSNRSSKPHQLFLSTNTPSGITQSGGPCILEAKTRSNVNPTCTLNLTIDGGKLASNHILFRPILCQVFNGTNVPNPNQCYQASSESGLVINRADEPGATTLSTSIPTLSMLALSVNDTATNSALTGQARKITITNTGSNPASGLSYSSTGLPTGTATSTNCGSTLASGSSCEITISPGSSPTSNCNLGTEPVPGTITVTATNVATPITSKVILLTYGCQYQGGFVYAVDDTTPDTGSIGGKVAALGDQAAPYITSGSQVTSIIWSSNGVGGGASNVSDDIIPSISEISGSPTYSSAQTTFNTNYSNTATYPFPASGAFETCSGATDGKCNSHNILVLYNDYQTNYGVGISPYALASGPTNLSYYAAGLCTATIQGYSDWYLPSICEMDAIYTAVSCPSGTQSMVGGLSFLLGDANAGTPSSSCTPPSGTDCLAGYYWSSTELSGFPHYNAWVEYFSSTFSFQYYTSKDYLLGVRCSRTLTP